MERDMQDQEKACQKVSLWVRVSASGFFFARESRFWPEKLLVDLVGPFCPLLMQA
jgi:hypothetical protein